MKKTFFFIIILFSLNLFGANENIVNETEVPYKEILLSVLGALSTFLIWRVQHQKDRIKDIENQLSEQKYKLYSELVYLVIDITMASKLDKPLSQKDILKRILNIKRDMFLYAPDNVFKMFTEWTTELNATNPGVNHFKTYFRMMKLARKDMGHRKSAIELDDFMIFLMQDPEEYRKFKIENNW